MEGYHVTSAMSLQLVDVDLVISAYVCTIAMGLNPRKNIHKCADTCCMCLDVITPI